MKRTEFKPVAVLRVMAVSLPLVFAAQVGAQDGASTGAAGDPARSENRDQSAAANGSEQWQKEFDQVDENGNDRADWEEVEQAYDAQLSQVEWDRRDVLNRYDPDGDDALDETEYQFFMSGLYHNQRDSQAGSQQGDQLSSAGAQNEDMESFAAAGAGDRAQRGSAETGQNEQSLESTTGPDQELPERGGEQFWNRPDTTAGVGPERELQEDNSVAGAGAREEGAASGQQSQEPAQQSTAGEGEDDREADQERIASPGQTEGRDQQESDQNRAAVTLITVTAVEPVPISDIEDREVINLQGDQVGSVQDVVTDPEGNETGLVVSVGGFLGVGDKEILVDMDEVQLTEERVVWMTSDDQDELESREEYNEKDYVSIR